MYITNKQHNIGFGFTFSSFAKNELPGPKQEYIRQFVNSFRDEKPQRYFFHENEKRALILGTDDRAIEDIFGAGLKKEGLTIIRTEDRESAGNIGQKLLNWFLEEQS